MKNWNRDDWTAFVACLVTAAIIYAAFFAITSGVIERATCSGDVGVEVMP